MDFFTQQDKARRKTKWLVIYFALAVISMIVLIYGLALLVSGYFTVNQHPRNDYGQSTEFAIWDLKLFSEVALGTIAVIFFGSAYKTMALSGGGSVVAESLGGRLVKTNTTDPDERKLLNVVEEMSIASGVPMPQVYVLDNEDHINAFAAGHTPGDAAVAVTRNCMTKLTRDELQGVIGHEFSHILNGDMRLNIRLIGILFGIFCIATIGRVLLYARSSSSRDRNPLPLFGLLLLIIGSLGVFFGRLIQAAVSRQREFLADASSVQFTRNPAGLSGALQKIGGYGSILESPHTSDASHLFFANGLADSLFGAMATHPPLEDRIRAIDSTWDGKFKRLEQDKPENLHPSRGGPSRTVSPLPQNVFGTVLGGAVLASGDDAGPPGIRPHTVLPNLGNPTPLHLRYAEQLRNALPESIRAAARAPTDATALIYAMLLSTDENLRARQLAEMTRRVDGAVSSKAGALFPELVSLGRSARLPLINLSIGALRNLTPDQFRQFSQMAEWLAGSDQQIQMFEFVLQKIIFHHLGPKFSQAPPIVVQYYSVKPLVPDAMVVLSAFAYASSDHDDEIRKAFEAGAPYLRAPQNVPLVLLPQTQCDVKSLDASLNRLAQAAPQIKKNLLDACIHVVGADGVIQETEAELLRAVADTLDCPMPPFVAD